jgi:hypothetical protein
MKKTMIMFAFASIMVLSTVVPGLLISTRAQSSDGWLLKWSYAYGGLGHCQFAQPIGDIDGDTVNEIVIGGYESPGSGLVRILSYDRNAQTYVEEYHWYIPGGTYHTPTGCCILDLDGDGNLEFVVSWGYSEADGIYAYRWDGRTLTLLDKYLFGGIFDVYACDYDDDGREEVLIAGAPSASTPWHVAAFRWENSKFVPEAFWRLGTYTWECPMIWSGDTDRDGKTEVIACISNGDYATAGTWALNWDVANREWHEVLVYGGLISGGTHYGVAVGDVDGDGTPEIGIGNNVEQYGAGACLIKWNGASYTKVWEKSWPNEYPIIEAVAVGDADNDGNKEFCAGGGYIHIIGWTGNGYVEKSTITETTGVLSGVNIGDCDTDALNELKACDILGFGLGKEWIFKYPQQKRPPKTNYKAVLVGMDYEDDNPPKHWYENATALKKALLTWDCWKKGIIRLVGPKANKNEIIGNLSAMNVGSDDFFLFYYSGHAANSSIGGNELVPPALTQEDERLFASSFPKSLYDDNLMDCLRKFDSNAEKVVILDACYSGGFWNGSDEGDLEKIQGTALLASEPEDKQSPEASDFTNALVKGIDRTTGRAPADADGDGEVTAREWFDYAKKTVPQDPIYGYCKQGDEDPLPPGENFGEKTTMYNRPVAAGHLDSAVSFTPGGFGGFSVHPNKLALLAPYICLTSTIIVAAVGTTIYVKRVRRRKEKQ